MGGSDGTTAPASDAHESTVRDDFTAEAPGFDAWLAAEWPLCEIHSVGWHMRRAAYRAGFDRGVGFAP